MTETEYAVRCFKDGKRRYTARLTKNDARSFRKAALHLAKFLKETYLKEKPDV